MAWVGNFTLKLIEADLGRFSQGLKRQKSDDFGWG